MEKIKQANIFAQMKKKARESKKLMLEIEICQIQRSLMEQGKKYYLLKMSEFPDMLEINHSGFLKFDYHDRYYTRVSLG